MSDDAERILAALDDAHGLCDALGLLEGGHGRGWYRSARGVTVRCPWHDEKSPSCLVSNPHGGFPIMAHCFGCNANGDAFTLIATVHNIDLRGAGFFDVLDIAADLAGVARRERRDASRPAPVRAIVRRPFVEVVRAPDDGTINRIAAVLSHVAPVTGSVAAMGYLRARGLDEAEARGWYALPDGPARDAVVAAVLEEVGYDAWIASGLATLDGPHVGRWAWSWRGSRLVIPWRAPNGTVETLQGRHMGPHGDDVKRYVFPAGHAPRWPFGAESVETMGPDTALAVVEGAIDAASFTVLAAQHGVDARAVGLPGVSSWDARWLRLFARRPAVVALDADKGGDRHVSTWVERLLLVARRGAVSVRRPVGGKDWNDVLTSKRRAA